MIKGKNYLVAPARLITLLLGGLIAMFITKTLIDNFGIEAFARYSVMTSIAALIPFADLGLGLNVFNIYAKSESTESPERAIKEKITLSFLLACAFSFVGIFFSFFIFFSPFTVSFSAFNMIISQSADAFIIAALTFLSAPLSFGFRKMYASGKILRAIFLGFLIPILNLSLTLIIIIFQNGFENWLIFTPSVSYFAANLTAFITAKVYKDLTKIDKAFFRDQTAPILKYAMFSTLFTSLVAITLQIPKYYFALLNQPMDVAKYSVFLLVISSLGSLVSAQASIYVPIFKKRRTDVGNRDFLVPGLKSVLLLSLVSIVVYFSGPNLLFLVFKIELKPLDSIVSLIILVAYLVWVFYNSFLSEKGELKELFRNGFISIMLSVLVLFAMEISSYAISLVFILGFFFFTLIFTSLANIFSPKESRYYSKH